MSDTTTQIQKAAVGHISTMGRLRKADPKQVAGIAESIKEVGLLNPITVVPGKVIFNGQKIDGYQLVAGLHRLEACKGLGWSDIPIVVLDLDEQRRIIAECDENLCGSVLTPAERATFTAKRKEAYEALHPEARHGATGRGGKKDANLASFSEDQAAKTGASKRTVQRDAERGQQVCQEALDAIKGSHLDTGAYLDQVKKLEPAGQVAKVQADLASPPKPKPEAAVEGDPSQVPTTETIEPEDSLEVAKLRKLFRSMTPAAQEDEYLGLHADLADLKAQIKDLNAERDGLKLQLSDLTADDKDEVIRRLTASVKTAENAKWRATEEQGRAMKQVYALKKRVEELEQMGVVKL